MNVGSPIPPRVEYGIGWQINRVWSSQNHVRTSSLGAESIGAFARAHGQVRFVLFGLTHHHGDNSSAILSRDKILTRTALSRVDTLQKGMNTSNIHILQ